MTPKGRLMMLAYGMAIMGTGNTTSPFDNDLRPQINYTKKKECFRSDCKRLRSGGKLYCSAECNELDKQRIKELNKK